MNYAIIMAAGKGLRLGGAVNKAILPLGDKPMLRWSIDAFDAFPQVGGILVAAAREDREAVREIARGTSKPCVLAEGGPTRQESVRHALLALPKNAEYVFIHDAARPFLAQALIERVLEGAKAQGAALPALPIQDTIRALSADGSRVIDRDALRSAQTPQCFRAADIIKAHQEASLEVTDDAALLEARGHSVRLVEGDPACFKITVPWDMHIARLIAAEWSASGRKGENACV